MVGSLLLSGGPPTIGWFIVSVVINSIYGLANWTWAHVLEKVQKVVSPSLTYLNATGPIFMEVLVIWVFASLNHSAPNIVFGLS